MSPFFANKEKRAEQEAAGAVEVERLCSMPVAELAAELMLAFGPGGARSKGSEGTPPMQIVQWLMASYPYHPSLKPLVAAVLAGLQALETAGLLGRRIAGDGSGAMRFHLTPVGETALAEGSVQRYLAPGSPA